MPVCKTCGNHERFEGAFKGGNPLRFVSTFTRDDRIIDIALIKEKEPDKLRHQFTIKRCFVCGSSDVEYKGPKEYLVACECGVRLKISNPVNGKRYKLRCPKCTNTFYHVVFLEEDYWKGFEKGL